MKRYLIFAVILLALPAFGQGTLSPQPHLQFLDNSGLPCSGCILTTYLAGTATLSATYSEYTLTTANPTAITLNSAGRPSNGGVEIALFLGLRSYKFTLTKAGSVIWTQDNISGFSVYGATTPAVSKRCVELTQESDGKIATDASLGNVFCVTITQNATLSNPTGMINGQLLTWQITMGTTGGYSLTLGNKFIYTTEATSITMPTTTGNRCWINAIYDSSKTDFPILSTTTDEIPD